MSQVDGGSFKTKKMLIVIVAFCLILIGPSVLYLTTNLMKLDLPSSLTSKEATYLVGGIVDVDMQAKVNIASFADGSFQIALEDEIANYIPMKASVLFADALRQRMGIEASNQLFAWPCYPTFYGSGYVYIPDQDALTWIASKEDDFDLSGFDSFYSKLIEVSRSNQSVDFIVYMTDPNNDTSPLNPTYKLVSNSMEYEMLAERMDGFLKTSPSNLTLLHGGGYDDLAEYYSQHYACDIHWNMDGTVDSCERICQELGNPLLDFDSYLPVDHQVFCGDIARRALYSLAERVYDTTYPFSNLIGIETDGAVIDLEKHQKYADADSLDKLYNFYGLYYETENEMTVTGGDGFRNTLLVGDSFARSMVRPLAESSQKLYRSPALFGDVSDCVGLKQHLAARDIDSVVFVGTPSNLASFIKRNPDFF